jgi:hypothetical protein
VQPFGAKIYNIWGHGDQTIFFLLAFQDVKVRPLVEYDSKSLEGIFPEIPMWVKNPDYDRVCSFSKLATNYIDFSCSFGSSPSSSSLD